MGHDSSTRQGASEIPTHIGVGGQADVSAADGGRDAPITKAVGLEANLINLSQDHHIYDRRSRLLSEAPSDPLYRTTGWRVRFHASIMDLDSCYFIAVPRNFHLGDVGYPPSTLWRYKQEHVKGGWWRTTAVLRCRWSAILARVKSNHVCTQVRTPFS